MLETAARNQVAALLEIGVQQKDIAKRMGMSKSQFTKWLNRKEPILRLRTEHIDGLAGFIEEIKVRLILQPGQKHVTAQPQPSYTRDARIDPLHAQHPVSSLPAGAEHETFAVSSHSQEQDPATIAEIVSLAGQLFELAAGLTRNPWEQTPAVGGHQPPPDHLRRVTRRPPAKKR